jgi:hypothetical protein
MSVLVGITSCDYFEYTARAVRTALDYTPDSRVLIVDDASDGWKGDRPPEALRPLFEGPDKGRVMAHQYRERFGLTRSWNKIVQAGKDAGCEFTVVSNNDVVFTRRWFDAIRVALDSPYCYDLAGPVTNAPGPTAHGRQQVAEYYHGFVADDSQEYLHRVADYLHDRFLAQPMPAKVNGFCFVARTDKWLQYAHSAGRAFNLFNTHNSKGEANPTPTMTLMEDEFQHRLYRMGGRAAVCPGSFVLHYRSVWRGPRYERFACGTTLKRQESPGPS